MLEMYIRTKKFLLKVEYLEKGGGGVFASRNRFEMLDFLNLFHDAYYSYTASNLIP